ncbi:MAG: hypothetical protein LUQ31_01260 [Methanoregula sp.]|nr:hypothetical protein [Methanoregula sp.]
MVEKNETPLFMLRCEPADPSDPAKLLCTIVSMQDHQVKKSVYEPARPSDKIKSDEGKQSSVQSDAEQLPKETMTVRKITKEGKVFLEVIESQTNEIADVKKSPIDQKADVTPSANKTGIGEQPQCDCKYCNLTRFREILKKKPVNKFSQGGKQ